MAQFLILQFLEVEGFERAKLLAEELLDIYITHGVGLAWMMVTRIPPMIATEPIPSDPDSTILMPCKQRDITSQHIIPMRPVLYFSYEGEVAVRGIAITPPSSIQDDDSHTATGDF